MLTGGPSRFLIDLNDCACRSYVGRNASRAHPIAHPAPTATCSYPPLNALRDTRSRTSCINYSETSPTRDLGLLRRNSD